MFGFVGNTHAQKKKKRNGDMNEYEHLCQNSALSVCFFFPKYSKKRFPQIYQPWLRDAKMVSLSGAPTEWLLINGILSYCPLRLKQVATTQEQAYKYFK